MSEERNSIIEQCAQVCDDLAAQWRETRDFNDMQKNRENAERANIRMSEALEIARRLRMMKGMRV